MCLPARLRKSWATPLVAAAKAKSLIWILPAPPPLLDTGGATRVSPKVNESTSISPLRFESLLSPEIPSSLRK